MYRNSINAEELLKQLEKFKPDFTVPTSKDEIYKGISSERNESHSWQPFKGMRVDTFHFRKKNDISVFSDAKFRGGVFNLSALDTPGRPKSSQKFG